jgi:hypothetical protein
VPWDKPSESKYNFKEKYKDVSTRELLDGIHGAKAPLEQFFGDRSKEAKPTGEPAPEREWSAAPAVWLTTEARKALEGAFREENEEALRDIIDNRSLEVPRRSPDIATTVYGEFLGLLAVNGVPVPKPRRSPLGIIYVMTRRQAEGMKRPIEEFLNVASDEFLSDYDLVFPHLILYIDEPDVVRRGIQHLLGALYFPEGMSALVLIGR